ncbi:MAG: hypothetical protein JNJ78_20775 [Anaerolineae bacterium]|nr:hypothetical protein [Anaerolineae bacterium]
MSDQSSPPEDPRWLDEFEELANRELKDGSSCEQVHPIVERWFEKLMQGDPPNSRDSVQQAMACLATEIIYNTPEDITEPLLEKIGEDELAVFIEHVLLIGRAFEKALDNGELDDL